MSLPTSNQRIDGRRLWESLMAMAEIGATEKGGVRRLALSSVDKAGRDRFRGWCEAAGLTVRMDTMGNMFARRPGCDPARLPVLFGSHLDSQPTGGKFDGALGVIAGLEVMRTLAGARHPDGGAGGAGELDRRGGRALRQGDDGLRRLVRHIRPGGDGGRCGTWTASAWGMRWMPPDIAAPIPAGHFAADSYFELHIEQGPILEAEGKTIGIVTGGQAQIWYDAVVTGRDSHAGTTPPSARRDALVGAARIIDLVDRTMRARGNERARHGRASCSCCRTAAT